MQEDKRREMSQMITIIASGYLKLWVIRTNPRRGRKGRERRERREDTIVISMVIKVAAAVTVTVTVIVVMIIVNKHLVIIKF